MSNVKKKAIIIIGVIVLVLTTSFITVTKLQQANRQRVVDAVQTGVDNLAESERQSRLIIAELNGTIKSLNGAVREREDLNRERERELQEARNIIQRFESSGRKEQTSLDNLKQIHSELEARDNKAREKDNILENNNLY